MLATKQFKASFLTKLMKNYKTSKALAKFSDHWLTLMLNLGLYNKEKNTFSLFNLSQTSFGFKTDILIVDGLTLTMLENATEAIENSFGCMLILNKKKRSNVIHAEFITEAPEGLKFKPIPNCKPWEIYIGNTFSKEPIIVDMIKYPHALISGGTRSGKSKLTDCMITNLAYNCTPEEVELYLIQVAKSDLVIYEDLDHTKAFASSVDEGLQVLDYIDKIMAYRDKLIRPFRRQAMASNYMEYNEISNDKPLSTIYVIFDEASSIFDSSSDDKITKKKKQEMVGKIKKIAQYGSGLGCFLGTSLQRPTASNLDPFVKSQATCIVSLRQNNRKSSEVATDDSNAALGLEQREFVYILAGHSKYGIVPWITNQDVMDNLRDKKGKKYSNFFRQFACDKQGQVTKIVPAPIQAQQTLPALNEPSIVNNKTKKTKKRITFPIE